MRINTGRDALAMDDLSHDATERGQDSPSRDDYISRLVKLVPAESIAAYPILMNATSDTMWTTIVTAWSLLLVTALLRWHKSKHPVTRKPQWTMVVIATVSFVIWVEAYGGSFGLHWALNSVYAELAAILQNESNYIITLALVLWTIIVPVFYTGD